MNDLKKKIYDLMLKNRRVAGGHQYTVPSPETYPYQWFWDSCFHAIILSHLSPGDAKLELLSLISKQFDNGMIPHMIYWDKQTPKDFPVIEWGKEDTSTITQPPLLSIAALRIYQQDQDERSSSTSKEFLEQIYTAAGKFCKYLLTERDPDGQDLAGLINPDESGEDNSPRFDAALGLPPKHTTQENFQKRLQLIEENKKCNFDAAFCTINFFSVKDVPFNCILVEELKAQAKIASILGKKKDARFFKKRAQDICSAMRTLMLEDGIFWPTIGKDCKKIKTLTWAIFAPLFAGIPTKKEAENLVKNHLQNIDRFNLKYLVPTVSKDDPAFDPDNFWRGPVWMAPNWFVFWGLKKYGFDALAQKILDSSVNLLEKEGFREYYNPLTGKGLGAKNFTWGGLVLDMF